MRERSNIIMEYSTYLLAYLVSYISSLAGLYFISGIVLIGEALFLYLRLFHETKNLIELRGLFTIAWVGGQGIACFQLSKLQKDWSPWTWVCFCLIYLGFGIGYEWKRDYQKEIQVTELKKSKGQSSRLLICIVGLAVISFICFILEAVILGFIPLFSEEPHAYSYFHISGVHYFTISCILIPAMTVLYFKISEQTVIKMRIIVALSNITAILIPVLCVSRFQLLFAVGFALVIFILLNKKIRLKAVIVLLLIMIPAYVLLTLARNHDVAYLNSIFEMKNSKMPIFITQPYIYIANNFENFNCMVEQLTEHTYGIRMLFPVFALTGLKFALPQITSTAIFLTKPELTTLTMFYDAFYDFGYIGVFFFAIIVGVAAKIIGRGVKSNSNPTVYLFYGQIAVYLGLAFFTTWFSNPTTWFWVALTSIIYWFIGSKKQRREA